MGQSSLRDFFYNSLGSNKGFFYYRDRYRTWEYSFESILSCSLKFASLLESSGVKKKDKILIKAKNSPDWVKIFIGCIMYGATVIPLDFKSGSDFVKMVKSDVGPSLFIGSKEEPKEQIKEYKGWVIPHIFIEDVEDKISNKSEFDFNKNKINDNDIAEIVYTSGTTSSPKGVILTYKNIQSNLKMARSVIEKWKRFIKIIPNSKLLSMVPLSHMYGQVVGIFIPASIGLSVLFSYSNQPRDVIETIKQKRIIALGALPQQLKILKDYIEQAFNLDSEPFKKIYQKYMKKRWWIRYLRFIFIHVKIGLSLLGIISGGAQIKEEVDNFYRTLAFGLFQGYGLTETAPLLALHDPTKNIAGSVGSFLDDGNVKVEDGELYVRGNYVTPGYYKNKQKTRKSFKDGWFRTGDIVDVDDKGNVFIRGRKDNLIVRESGENVYPSDIAEKFRKYEQIRDCAVFGMEDDGRTEIVVVLLLKDKSYEKSKIESLVGEVNENLNPAQKVDDYLIWEGDDFPRTSSLNINKRQIISTLKESLQKGKTIAEKIEKKEEGKDIYNILNKVKKIRGKKDSQASLEKDLGMDSLDIISLSTEIEKEYGIDSSQLDITSDTKIEDIEKSIKNPPKKTSKLPFFNFAFNRFFIYLRIVFQYLIYPFVRMLYRSKISGRQNLKNIGIPTAFISNHVSVMDSLVILYSLPLRIRKRITVVMSIRHHFTHFFSRKGNIIRRFIEGLGFYLFIGLYINVIPLSRHFGFEQVFKNIGLALDRGWNVLIFPEGAVTPDGKIKKFEQGIGIICSDMKIPVVPMRIDGLHNILRNGLLPWGHLPKVPMVKITIGKQQYHKKGSYKDITKKLHNIVAEKLGN